MLGSHAGNKSWVIYDFLLHFLAIANISFIEKWQKLQFGFLLCSLPASSPPPSLFFSSFLGELALGLGDESLWRQMSVKGTESKHGANEPVARFYLPSLKIQYPEKEE